MRAQSWMVEICNALSPRALWEFTELGPAQRRTSVRERKRKIKTTNDQNRPK